MPEKPEPIVRKAETIYLTPKSIIEGLPEATKNQLLLGEIKPHRNNPFQAAVIRSIPGLRHYKQQHARTSESGKKSKAGKLERMRRAWKLMDRGQSDKVIADQMELSPKTIGRYRKLRSSDESPRK